MASMLILSSNVFADVLDCHNQPAAYCNAKDTKHCKEIEGYYRKICPLLDAGHCKPYFRIVPNDVKEYFCRWQ
jgi:hypothetical protein